MDKILKFGATIGAILILTSGSLPSIAFSIFLLFSIYYETGQPERKNHPTKLKKTVQFNDEIDLRNYTLLEEEEDSELSTIENDAVMTKKIIRKFKNPPAEESVDYFDGPTATKSCEIENHVELELDLAYLYPVFQKKNLQNPKLNYSYNDEAEEDSDDDDLLDTTENLMKH